MYNAHKCCSILLPEAPTASLYDLHDEKIVYTLFRQVSEYRRSHLHLLISQKVQSPDSIGRNQFYSPSRFLTFISTYNNYTVCIQLKALSEYKLQSTFRSTIFYFESYKRDIKGHPNIRRTPLYRLLKMVLEKSRLIIG